MAKSAFCIEPAKGGWPFQARIYLTILDHQVDGRAENIPRGDNQHPCQWLKSQECSDVSRWNVRINLIVGFRLEAIESTYLLKGIDDGEKFKLAKCCTTLTDLNIPYLYEVAYRGLAKAIIPRPPHLHTCYHLVSHRSWLIR